MDWPVIGAVAGLTTLTGAVAVGGWMVLHSAPPAVSKPKTPLLLAERTNPPERARTAYALARTPPAGDAARPLGSLPPSPVLISPQQPIVARPAPPDLADVPPPAPRRSLIEAPPRPMLPERVAPPSAAPHNMPQKPAVQMVDERYAHVLTHDKIADLRRMLRLLPEQRPNWPPVERVLREIGRIQLAHVRRGETPEVDSGVMMQLYSAAQPLLSSLNPDQKERIRALAKSLGYPSVASML